MSGMKREDRIPEARALMLRFASRTGIEGDEAPRRYLWTDAFAVCNALALWDATGEERFRSMALVLVDQVHGILGRHRPDDSRRGWVSGLPEDDALRHPTCGGLRIGKPLPERAADEAFDERLEWDRDGQYFHYLTRWMHALDQLARRTGDAQLNVWARELAVAAHRGFVGGPRSGRLAMVWKMSIDLSRPLVPSMGQHDPIDGLVTCLELSATAESLPGAAPEPSLERIAADFAALAAPQPIVTLDPLGIGGLLMDASRVAQLIEQGTLADDGLFLCLLDGACRSLGELARANELDRPATRRLAFRELGLAIGLAALEPIERLAKARLAAPAEVDSVQTRLEVLRAWRGMRDTICEFWCEPAHRRVATWIDHVDINEVMLATALVPDGWVTLTSTSVRTPDELERERG